MADRSERDLFMEVRGALKVRECESKMHWTGEDNAHAGWAAWWIILACPNCGWTSIVSAICGTWVKYMKFGGGTLRCADCGVEGPGYAFIQTMEKM